MAPSIAQSIAMPGRKPRSRSSCAAAIQLTAAARRVPAKFIQPTSTSSGMKHRSSRCRSGRLPGRINNAVAAGIASTTARVATISCHTPCCGRLAPNSDIAGQSDSDTTARRAAAPVAGSTRPPAARAPISTAKLTQAATDQKAAGTAVEPRTRKTPQADTAAARPAATQAAVWMSVAGSMGMMPSVAGGCITIVTVARGAEESRDGGVARCRRPTVRVSPWPAGPHAGHPS